MKIKRKDLEKIEKVLQDTFWQEGFEPDLANSHANRSGKLVYAIPAFSEIGARINEALDILHNAGIEESD